MINFYGSNMLFSKHYRRLSVMIITVSEKRWNIGLESQSFYLVYLVTIEL